MTNSGYNHFGGAGGLLHVVGLKCPLYDDSVQRNDRNAKAAEEKAKKKIRAENPNLSEADLDIKFQKEVQGSPQSPFRGGMGFPGGQQAPLPPVAPGPLNHQYQMFPQNGPDLGYAAHRVGWQEGPPMYPQNGPYNLHMAHNRGPQ